MNSTRLLTLILIALPLCASAADIELHPGESFEAAVESLQPGDMLTVFPGTYAHNARVAITVAGTSQAPVVVQGLAGQPPPTIVLGTSGHNVIDIDGASYLTLRHLEITANGIGGADAINMRGNPSYLTLEDLVIHDVSVGINFRSSMHHITVRRNHIYNTKDTGEGMYVGCHDGSCAVSDSIIEFNWIHDTTGADQGDGIEIKRGSHSNIIRDNVIHDTKYPCIVLYGTEGNPRNVVERNVMWNCADAGIQVAADTVLRNNIIIPGSGRGFASQSHAGVSPGNLDVVHNTILGGSPCLHFNGWNNAPGMVFANNAVYCGGSNYSIGGLSGATLVGNVFDHIPSAFPEALNTQGRSETEDFVDAAAKDLYPSADSRLIAAGDATYAVPDDFNTVQRASTADAGAYAWSGPDNPGWRVGPGFKGEGNAPQLSFSANPHSVDYQGETELSWMATNATACDASGDWTGTKARSGSENVGPLTTDSTFVLTCSNNASLSVDQTVNVDVADPAANAPTLDFSAAASTVPINGSTELMWSSTDASDCQASGSWTGTKPSSGTESTGALSANATFELECSGAGGSVMRSVSVQVQTSDLADDSNESGGGSSFGLLLTILIPVLSRILYHLARNL